MIQESGFDQMAHFVTFVLCLTAVNAAFSSNHSSLSGVVRQSVNGSKPSRVSSHGNIQHVSQDSRMNQTFLQENGTNSSSLNGPKDFIDCTKCEL